MSFLIDSFKKTPTNCGVYYFPIFITFVAQIMLMRYWSIIMFLLGVMVSAQLPKKLRKDSTTIKNSDTLVIDSGKKDSLKIFKPTRANYSFKTRFGTPQLYDSTFSIQGFYQNSQYNNKDNFGKIQFSNIGSGFQDLVYHVNTEQNLTLLPTNKSHVIIGANDVKYYDVKTPTTSFIYHSGMRNGAALQSTYTQNIGKRFNFALEYMGLRSQGFYQNQLASNNNTIFSGHYQSKNGRYEAYGHYLHQNVNNEENGGIADLDIFLSGDSRFKNRQNLEVNLEDTNSRYSYRRYYFSHELTPFNADKYPFKLRHTFFYQSNKYYYNQDSEQSFYFSDADTDLVDYDLNSKKYSKNLSNTVSLLFDKPKFKLDAGVRYQNLVLGTRDGITIDELVIPSEIKEGRLGAVGNLKMNLWDKVDWNSGLEFSNGKEFGNFLRSENQLKIQFLKDYILNAKVNFQSASPSFNYLLNTSVYKQYNYYYSDAKNEAIMEIGGDIALKWLDSKLFANYFRIDNYAYFDSDGQPNQSTSSMNISQIGGEATLNWKKFHLNTKLLFQSAINNKDLYPMPSFIGRANFYWQTMAFKNAAEIQTGIKGYYFSKFASRDFLPILNEFVLPNSAAYSIGGEPIVDVYFNLKVKTMRIYVEGQNMTRLFMQNKSFTAPYYPIYDFRLNLGLVWNLFH